MERCALRPKTVQSRRFVHSTPAFSWSATKSMRRSRHRSTGPTATWRTDGPRTVNACLGLKPYRLLKWKIACGQDCGGERSLGGGGPLKRLLHFTTVRHPDGAKKRRQNPMGVLSPQPSQSAGNPKPVNTAAPARSLQPYQSSPSASFGAVRTRNRSPTKK